MYILIIIIFASIYDRLSEKTLEYDDNNESNNIIFNIIPNYYECWYNINPWQTDQ